jgi:hypothetical protein
VSDAGVDVYTQAASNLGGGSARLDRCVLDRCEVRRNRLIEAQSVVRERYGSCGPPKHPHANTLLEASNRATDGRLGQPQRLPGPHESPGFDCSAQNTEIVERRAFEPARGMTFDHAHTSKYARTECSRKANLVLDPRGQCLGSREGRALQANESVRRKSPRRKPCAFS